MCAESVLFCFSPEQTVLLRHGIGSIVLQKEIMNNADPNDPNGAQNFFVSNLDQLASAAMSSAGLEPAHFEEVVSSRTPKKRQPKAKKPLPSQPRHNELEDAIRKSDFSLKHLLTGGKFKEEDEVLQPNKSPSVSATVKKLKQSLAVAEVKMDDLPDVESDGKTVRTRSGFQ